MSPLILSGLLVGALAAVAPFLLRLTGVGWLRMASVPLATVLFATSFTLAGNGPLLRPLLAGVTAGQSMLASGAAMRGERRGSGLASRPATLDLQGAFGPRVLPEGPMLGIGYRDHALRGAGDAIVSVRMVEGKVWYRGSRAGAGIHWLHRVRGAF